MKYETDQNIHQKYNHKFENFKRKTQIYFFLNTARKGHLLSPHVWTIKRKEKMSGVERKGKQNKCMEPLGKFLRDSRTICTIKAFQMMKFERRDDSKLHLYIGFC